MAEHPKVFISYSHDSPEHRRWVSELGAKLRHNGIDAILDQWDLGPGDDVTQFMERGIMDSDRVLVVCTDQYVRKANAGEGGVGYERMIVTAQLAQDLGTNKLIPVIRQASAKEKIPWGLRERIYIDFTDDGQFDAKFDELLRELYQAPVVQKPPLGKNPFAQPPEIPEQVESAADAYAAAVKLARAGDVLGWRQLVKGIKPSAFNSLIHWRQNELEGYAPNTKEPFQVVNQAVEIISPLISVALVGIESGREQFKDQKATFDDLLNIAGWNPAGYTTWVNLPNALGYVYHSLHGSLSLITNQLDLALGLARAKIPIVGGIGYSPVWKMGELRGYSESISGTRGGNSLESWNYLAEAYKKWEWLALVFQDEQEYRTSLIAYYMALHIHELADDISSGQQDTLEANLSSTSSFRSKVPLTFLSEEYNITQRAVTLLHNQEDLTKLWTCLNVTREQMENSWESWIQLADDQLLRMGLSIKALHGLSDIYRNFFGGL